MINSILIQRWNKWIPRAISRHYSFGGRRAYVNGINIKGRVLGIRREDASIWERRAPLAPNHVKQLVNKGVKVLVQPSNRRAFPMQAYASAGAIIQEDLSEANVIVGVKQVPIDSLIPNKTYCFFSHTIKAQEANMPLLDALLEKNITLIDYEKMVDNNGQRVVAFGKWAGVAGMINILHGLGLRLLALGHHTPFMHIGPAHNYRNSGMARQAIRDAGYEIALGMMPKSIGPLTFVFTGSGNVSQGAQEMFAELPHEYVSPDMLKKVAERGPPNKVYACSISRHDHLQRKGQTSFDADEYEEYPDRYYSTFSKSVAPYASVIVNGIYWAVNSPKLITIPDAKYLLRPASTPWLDTKLGSPPLPHRLLAISDISADPGGSIEFMTECTTIDNPFCLYDAEQHQNTESFAGPGVLVCSIDNMPTQLPLEATEYFGEQLLPHINDMIQSDATKSLEENNFSPTVHGAIITSNGKLTPNFEYIQDLRMQTKAKKFIDTGNGKKKVLVLGAGYVSEPMVEYLNRDDSVSIVVAAALRDESDRLARKFNNVEPVLLDVVERSDLLEDLIKGVDVVVSLLPYGLHTSVAKICIQHRVNMITASYVSPQMRELDQLAKNNNVTILNEIGLDPGIDHLLAMECIDEVHRNGGKIISCLSYCGGLPAPEYSENPLRYKFSWSPKQAFMGALNGAKYKKDGRMHVIPEGGDLLNEAAPVDFFPGFKLEGIPNRDSTQYASLYGVDEAATFLRGTLRYQGYCSAIKGLLLCGLLDKNAHPCLHPRGPDISWKEFLCHALGVVDPSIFVDNFKNVIYEKVGRDQFRLDAVEALGLLSDEPIEKLSTPIDTLTNYMHKKLSYAEGERDIVIMRHEIEIQWPNLRKECRSVNLVAYGDPHGYSAMAKTVGYPAGIATKMILNGEIQKRGIIVPITPDLYSPLLNRLKLEGIVPMEHSKMVE
ncbi:hypothetical protein CHUAL_003353 [Chamberlinius hualienensis]